MCKKKHRLYNRAKATGKKRHWDMFRTCKKETQKAICNAHWKYVNFILTDSPEKNETKPFWWYIKARRQENIGVTSLKRNGSLYRMAQKKEQKSSTTSSSRYSPEMTGALLCSQRDRNILASVNVYH